MEKWFNTNLKNYESKIADGKYCNDRNVQSGSTWSSASSSTFHYAPLERRNVNAPTLSCYENDIYTLKIGFITLDEVIYAGGRSDDNSLYYLYNGQDYWTMSPCWWYHDSINYSAVILAINSNGNIGGFYGTGNILGVRPVINLISNLSISGGNGTINNPYIVN